MLVRQLDDDAFSQSTQIHHLATGHRIDWWLDRLQERRPDDADLSQALAHDAASERFDVDRDVGEFRHPRVIA